MPSAFRADRESGRLAGTQTQHDAVGSDARSVAQKRIRTEFVVGEVHHSKHPADREFREALELGKGLYGPGPELGRSAVVLTPPAMEVETTSELAQPVLAAGVVFIGIKHGTRHRERSIKEICKKFDVASGEEVVDDDCVEDRWAIRRR